MDSPEANDGGAALRRATTASVLASAVTVLVAIARSKVTAEVLGPEGLGRATEVTQTVALALVPTLMLTGPALLRAAALARDDAKRQQQVFDTFLWALAVMGVVLAPVGVGLTVSLFGSSGSDTALLALLAAVGQLGATALDLPRLVLVARGEAVKGGLVLTLTSLIVTSAVLLGTWLHGLSGQFQVAAILPWLLLALSAAWYRRAIPGLQLLPTQRPDLPLLKESVALGLTVLIANLGSQGALSVVRWALTERSGSAANGQFQAVWAVASTYLGVVLTGISTVYAPRFSVAPDAAVLGAEVRSAVDFVMRSGPPLILLAIGLRGPVLHALYSDRFGVAADALGITMAADLGKALAWVHAWPLASRGLVWPFVLTELAGSLLLAGVSVLLVPQLEVQGAAFAYWATYFVYVWVTAWALQRFTGARAAWREVAISALFSIALLLVMHLANPTVATWGLTALGLVWGVLNGSLLELPKALFARLGRLRARLLGR